MWRKDNSEFKGQGAPGEEGPGQTTQQPTIGGVDNNEEVIAFVGKGVEFRGVITYNGTVRIDGHLDGEIHTEGVLLVGEEAVITAKVSAGTIVSKGKITGDIIAHEKIRLLSPAVLNGSVKTPTLSMEEGVLFNGNCEMARADIHELPRPVNVPLSSVKRKSG